MQHFAPIGSLSAHAGGAAIAAAFALH